MLNRENRNEIIRYLIVGVLTTVVSLGSYYLCVKTVLNPGDPVQLQIANIISWILAVTFAYIANRKYVFQSTNRNKLKEIAAFYIARLTTLGMDMAIMFIGVSLFRQNDKVVKLLVQVIVTAANYTISKVFVFKKAVRDAV